MCLLVMLTGTHPDVPLLIAANRDELLERPAIPMAVLRETSPRILGGRDELAGGTWLAVNDAGVVAGLTNRPVVGERDPSKRSRGELPIALASYRSAAEAVEQFASEVRPSDYNPAWLLVGDRDGAYFVDVSGDTEPAIAPLAPGIHILENRPLGAMSPKVEHVRQLLAGVDNLHGDALAERLQEVLGDHDIPEGKSAGEEAGREDVPPQVKANCVHAEIYGTRWSGVITVPADRAALPTIRYVDGPACKADWRISERRCWQ
jgi:uncharacterized protein with NRDE domain